MHETTLRHRYDWPTRTDEWRIECWTCGWVSDPQRTPGLAAERETEHLDLPEADTREVADARP